MTTPSEANPPERPARRGDAPSQGDNCGPKGPLNNELERPFRAADHPIATGTPLAAAPPIAAGTPVPAVRPLAVSTPAPADHPARPRSTWGPAAAIQRGALLFWAALLTLAAAAIHLIGVAAQPPDSGALVALLVIGALIQLAIAVVVVLNPARRVLVAAALTEVAALALWFLARATDVPISGAVWRPETLGAMDYYLPALEALSAVLFLALLGRTLPRANRVRAILVRLPLVLGLVLLVLAVLNSKLTTILLVVVFFTTGFPTSLIDLFVPVVALLVALLVARLVWTRLREQTPRAGEMALRLLPALFLTSLLAWGGASTAMDRSWLSTPAPVRVAAGKTTTLAYCSPGGAPLAMDLTEPPAGTTRPAPAVFYVHGGEGLVGDRVLQGDEGPYLTHLRDELANQGFVVGSIDYDLAPFHHLNEEVEDAKCAARFLRANAPTLGIDPNRIGVYGDSEGGYISAMLGVTAPAAGYDVGQYLSQSSRVQAVVDMWGFTELTNWTGSPSWIALLGSSLSGGSASAAQLRAASPINDVAPGDPPFLIIHGTDDWFIAPHHSQDFAQRLRAANVPVTLVMVQHGGHGLDSPTAGQVQQPSPTALAQLIDEFFGRTLAG